MISCGSPGADALVFSEGFVAGACAADATAGVSAGRHKEQIQDGLRPAGRKEPQMRYSALAKDWASSL